MNAPLRLTLRGRRVVAALLLLAAALVFVALLQLPTYLPWTGVAGRDLIGARL